MAEGSVLEWEGLLTRRREVRNWDSAYMVYGDLLDLR